MNALVFCLFACLCAQTNIVASVEIIVVDYGQVEPAPMFPTIEKTWVSDQQYTFDPILDFEELYDKCQEQGECMGVEHRENKFTVYMDYAAMQIQQGNSYCYNLRRGMDQKNMSPNGAEFLYDPVSRKCYSVDPAIPEPVTKPKKKKTRNPPPPPMFYIVIAIMLGFLCGILFEGEHAILKKNQCHRAQDF